MFSMKNTLLLSATILAASASMDALANKDGRILIAPTCLISKTDINATKLAANQSYQLIQTETANIEKLALAKHHSACGSFKDVTRAWHKASRKANNPAQFLAAQTAHKASRKLANTYKINHPKETNEMIATLVPENMWNNLTKLTTAFDDRYANSENGVRAAHHIKDVVEGIAKKAGHDDDFTAYFVETGGYKQPSVVTKLGKGDGPGIVIGAHMDTLSGTWSNKPGADDDGSGTVTLLETARNILESGKHFDKPIYFIWYAAEEMGLVGSDYVVGDFEDKQIPVAAAMQLDMTGYAYKNEPTMWLMTDYVDSKLTSFLETLITTYVKKPVKYSKCGYGCSDHASWYYGGVPASFPFEAKMGQEDPYIHSSNDTMEPLSLEHMTDYAKLATAFAVELASPKA